MSFKKVRTVQHPDHNCNLIEYVHQETGLRHFHLASSFPELLFSLALPTTPVDDTGLPHILEHITLSGGEKYPIKDPFTNMLSRSVAHNMNAMTMHMVTNYHYATTLEKDFFNLSDVYLDAVFTPLLRREDFEQEGWRMEKDGDGLEIKGVVFNEMKGVYAEPGMHIREVIYKGISPNTSLAYSSGGHPLCIPSLSYERLLDYHSKNYNPKRAVLTTSGDIDIEKLHKQVEETLERYQKRMEKNTFKDTNLNDINNIPSHAFNNNFGRRKTTALGDVITTSILSPVEAGNNLFLPFLGEKPKNAREELFDQVMTDALFSSSNSKTKKIADELGVSFGAEYLFNDFIQVLDKTGILFSVSGDKDLNVDKWRMIVDNIWKSLSQEDFDIDGWKSAIVQMKTSIISSMEESPSGTVLDIAYCATLGIDPLMNANNIAILNDLEKNPPTKEEVANWCKRFSTNPQPALVTEPDPDLLNKWVKDESKIIDRLVGEGFEPNPKLLDENEEGERQLANKLLPFIDEKDLSSPLTHKIPVTSIPSDNDATSITHFQAKIPTSQIIVSFDFGALSPSFHTLMVMNIWSALSYNLGSSSKTANEQRTLEDIKGVSIGWGLGTEIDINGKAGLIATCAGSSLSANSLDLANFIASRIEGVPVFEEDKWKANISRLLDHVNKDKASRHRSQAIHASMAPFSSSLALRSQFSQYMENHRDEWLQKALDNPRFALEEFEYLFNQLKNAPSTVTLIGDDNSLESAKVLARKVNQTKNSDVSKWDNLSSWTRMEVDKPLGGEMKVIPSPVLVNHCFYTYPAPRIDHPDAPATNIAMNLLDPLLHKIIREEGGAYGASASWNSGIVFLSSFRDPNFKETFDVFDSTPNLIKQVIEGEDEQSLKEAKLRVFKSFTAPRSARKEAMRKMNMAISGIDESYELNLLKQSTKVTWEDLRRVSNDWLSPPSQLVSKSAVVSHQQLEKENDISVNNSNIRKKVGYN